MRKRRPNIVSNPQANQREEELDLPIGHGASGGAIQLNERIGTIELKNMLVIAAQLEGRASEFKGGGANAGVVPVDDAHDPTVFAQQIPSVIITVRGRHDKALTADS